MERSMLLLVLDLVGIAVFAAAGALSGISKRLDLFGVVVIAGVTSLGGGFVRDVLLGDTPPVALRDWRYLVAPIQQHWWSSSGRVESDAFDACCSRSTRWASGCSQSPGRRRHSAPDSVCWHLSVSGSSRALVVG